MRLGSNRTENGSIRFRVWAPFAQHVELILNHSQKLSMQSEAKGYWMIEVQGLPDEVCYGYAIDGKDPLPDPVSRYQPDGVHDLSAFVDPTLFKWTDTEWQPQPLEEWIIYELHVGTFTSGGTFDAVCEKLDHLVALGVNVVELMPLAQTPGNYSWGYSGVLLYAVQQKYGGAEGLRRFVNEAHARGIAVILDVVYNHLGPEGNYLHAYGPYFSDKYQTPWGSAINLDGAYSDEVRFYFVENMLYWLREYHLDGFRMDAIHELHDESAYPFLAELSDSVRDFEKLNGKQVMLIAESAANDPREISSTSSNGLGIDAVWADDFHHAVYTLLTGDNQSYYGDYGKIAQLAKVFEDGFVYTGQYSNHLKCRWGRLPVNQKAFQFVVCVQNHDRVGNRMKGERFTEYLSLDQVKLAVFTALLSPFVPMLFMGEETADPSPFLFFTSFSDPKLQEAVREGRKKEFSAFQWKGEPPDPLSPQTFKKSILQWDWQSDPQRKSMFEFYTALIQLRKDYDVIRYGGKKKESSDTDRGLETCVPEGEKVLLVRRFWKQSEVLLMMNYGDHPVEIDHPWIEKTGDILFDTQAIDEVGEKLATEVSLRPWQGILVRFPEGEKIS